jgi:hypothetical protein
MEKIDNYQNSGDYYSTSNELSEIDNVMFDSITDSYILDDICQLAPQVIFHIKKRTKKFY